MARGKPVTKWTYVAMHSPVCECRYFGNKTMWNGWAWNRVSAPTKLAMQREIRRWSVEHPCVHYWPVPLGKEIVDE